MSPGRRRRGAAARRGCSCVGSLFSCLVTCLPLCWSGRLTLSCLPPRCPSTRLYLPDGHPFCQQLAVCAARLARHPPPLPHRPRPRPHHFLRHNSRGPHPQPLLQGEHGWPVQPAAAAAAAAFNADLKLLNPRPVQDTDDVDFLLSMSMSEFGNCIMQLLATIIFIAVVQVGGGWVHSRLIEVEAGRESIGSRRRATVQCTAA